jgi:hypothetical protein
MALEDSPSAGSDVSAERSPEKFDHEYMRLASAGIREVTARFNRLAGKSSGECDVPARSSSSHQTF